jgi:hypothetical protein
MLRKLDGFDHVIAIKTAASSYENKTVPLPKEAGEALFLISCEALVLYDLLFFQRRTAGAFALTE